MAMSLGRIGALVLAGVLALGTPPAHAAEASPSLLTLDSAPRYADADISIVVTLAEQGSGSPVVDAEVVVERRVDGAWSEVAAVSTDEDGRATVVQTLARDADDNVFRATYDGDDGPRRREQRPPSARRSLRRESVVSVGGRDRVVDEQQVAVRVRWRTRSGLPVPGRVQLWRRNAGDDWRRLPPGPHRQRRAGAGGGHAARGHALACDRAAARLGHRRPQPRAPDRQPAARLARAAARGAPRPRVDLPRQDRATGDGANASVSRIPDRVWQQMTGRSWHAGCPVGRSALRLLRINYWGYDGYRYRGELVAHTDAVDNMRGALDGALCPEAARSGRCTASTGSGGRAGSRAPTTTARWPRATPRRSTAGTSSAGPASARRTRGDARSTSTRGRTRTTRPRAGCRTRGGRAARTPGWPGGRGSTPSCR